MREAILQQIAQTNPPLLSESKNDSFRLLTEPSEGDRGTTGGARLDEIIQNIRQANPPLLRMMCGNQVDFFQMLTEQSGDGRESKWETSRKNDTVKITVERGSP